MKQGKIYLYDQYVGLLTEDETGFRGAWKEPSHDPQQNQPESSHAWQRSSDHRECANQLSAFLGPHEPFLQAKG